MGDLNIVGVLGPSRRDRINGKKGRRGFATKQQPIVKLYTFLYLLDNVIYKGGVTRWIYMLGKLILWVPFLCTLQKLYLVGGLHLTWEEWSYKVGHCTGRCQKGRKRAVKRRKGRSRSRTGCCWS